MEGRDPGSADRFEIADQLGAGGAGTVYRARDHRRGSDVALKLLRHASGSSLYRFKREFRSLADIAHPNLVTLQELHTTGSSWFFTMELVPGVSFLAWVRREDAVEDVATVTRDGSSAAVDGPAAPVVPRQGALDLGRLLDALPQLVDGVLALHVSGKLHRDVKPSNVLVTADGRVVLLDFGLIADVEAADHTHERAAVGTPAYMSPEQAADEPLSTASDWYSVGVMLFEALTGRRPFEGPTSTILHRKQVEPPPRPASMQPGVPPELDELCWRLLAPTPEDRPDGRAILAALGRAPSRATLELERTMAPGPFVGRDHDLATLGRALSDSRTRGVAVFVRGESGMGKSQLVRQFLDTVGDEVTVLEGRCYESESVPFKTVDTVIDALARILLALPADEAAAMVPAEVAALARLFPAFRRVPIIDQRAFGGRLPDDPVEVHRRAFAALHHLLTRLAARGQLVIAIDDLQWGDADSAVFLARLVHDAAPVPLLLVLVHRPDDDAGIVASVRTPRAGLPPGDVRTIEVGPLDVTDARALVSAHGADGLDTTETLLREGAGHPLFLIELARARGDARLDAAMSLEELLVGRIAALPARARALLCATAVAARPVPIAVAAQAAGIGAASAELGLLRAERLLRVRAGADGDTVLVEPYHDRIRAAAAGMLAPADRRQVNEDVARSYEATGAAEIEILVEHWLAAGQPLRAAGYASRAAAAAADKLAFRRAAALYLLAIEHGADDDGARRALLALRGHALAHAGALDEAAAVYAEAARGAPNDEALRLEALRLEQLLRRGRLAEGLALARSVLGRVGVPLPKSPPQAFREAVFQRIRIRLRGLDHVERAAAEVPPEVLRRIDILTSTTLGMSLTSPVVAKALQFRLMRLALDAGEPERIIVAFGLEIGSLAAAGMGSQARVAQLSARVRAMLDRHGQPRLEAFVTGSEGIAMFVMGRFRDARHLLETSVRDMRALGQRWETNLGEMFLTLTLFYLGETREMVRLVPIFLRDAIERGDIHAAHAMRGWRTNVAWLVTGNPAEARAHADAVARERSSIDGFHLQHYYELVAQTQIDLYEGDAEAAWRRIDSSWRALSDSYLSRGQLVRVESRFLRARACLALAIAHPRDRAAGLAEVSAIVRQLDREGAGFAHAHAEQCRAAVAAIRGDRDGAADHLERAERAYAGEHMALFAALMRLRRGPLTGGTSGELLVADAREAMTAQAVADVDAFARLLCPWPT